jgi:hypothetical protein
MRLRRFRLSLLVIALVSASAEAATSRPTTRPVYTNEDLDKHHPTATPSIPTADGRATATVPAPTAVPESIPFDDSPSISEAQRRIRREQMEEAQERVASARRQVAEVEAKLAAAKSLSRPLAIYGTLNPEVPGIEEELEAAKKNLAEAEQAVLALETEAGAGPGIR